MSDTTAQNDKHINEPISDGASESAKQAEHEQDTSVGAEAFHQPQLPELPELHIEAPDASLLDDALLEPILEHNGQAGVEHAEGNGSSADDADNSAAGDASDESAAESVEHADAVDSADNTAGAADEAVDAIEVDADTASDTGDDTAREATESDGESKQGDEHQAGASAFFGDLHASDKLKKRKAVLRRIVAPIFAAIAICAVIVGVLNLTVWRVNPQVDIATDTVQTSYMVTDAGVLDTTDGAVTITARSGQKTTSSKIKSNQPVVCLAIASSADATGWLEGSTYTRITGYTSWERFATTQNKAKGKAEQSAVAFAQSDMWQQLKCGTGKVSVTWQHAAGKDVVALAHVLSEQEQAVYQQQSADKQTDAHATADANADANAADSADSNDSKQSKNTQKTELNISMQWVRGSVPDYATAMWILAGISLLLAVLCAVVLVRWPKPHVPRVGRHGHGARSAQSTSRVEHRSSVTTPASLQAAQTGDKQVADEGADTVQQADGSDAGTTASSDSGSNDADSAGNVKTADATSAYDEDAGERTEVLPVVDELPTVSTVDLQDYFARLMKEQQEQEQQSQGQDETAESAVDANEDDKTNRAEGNDHE